MQINSTTGDKYDCRNSKDDPETEFTINYLAVDKVWNVSCWKGEDCHWTQYYYDSRTYTLPETADPEKIDPYMPGQNVTAEIRALYEFNRFA